MSYTVTASEKTNKSATEQETKSLLFLMSMYKDSDKIHFFVIDFFNDVSGVDKSGENIWDIQSKASSGVNAKAVGKYLITLYKNYCSDFQDSFCTYILFLGGVASTLRKDNTKNIFSIKDIKEKGVKSIRAGLLSECKTKEYARDFSLDDKDINDFLSKVTFVINDKDKSDYIKSLININPIFIPQDGELEAIFDDIRDVQSTKKNIDVEKITINNVHEFAQYKTHLLKENIICLVLQRLIGIDISKGKDLIPNSFVDVISKCNKYERKETIEDCQNHIMLALCDTNNQKNFWDFFYNCYEVINNNLGESLDELYNNLNKEICKSMHTLNFIDIKYFLAILKDKMS